MIELIRRTPSQSAGQELRQTEVRCRPLLYVQFRGALVPALVRANLAVVPLTQAEKSTLREYVLERACNEYRNGESCIQRNDSPMIGDMHAGCDKAERMIALVDRA